MSAEYKIKTPNSNNEVLIAEDLKRNYGGRQALKGLSFSLKAGHVLGFLGPNGAGKTTAIRILTTIMEPDSGHFVVDGIHSDYPDKIRSRIGVLPETLGFPKQITGMDLLIYFGKLYGYSSAQAKENAEELAIKVGLEKRAKSLIGSYSRGMRQRLGIARALVNNPAVVFLDEPTLGLDPRGQKDLLALIQRIAAEWNAAVVLCSHHITDIQSVCDDVVILNLGQVVASGSVHDIIEQTHHNSIRIRIPLPSLNEAKILLEAIPGIINVNVDGKMSGWLGLELDDISKRNDSDKYQINNIILNSLIGAQIPVISFEAEKGHLRDVFLNLTEEETE